ncbi:MAG: M15 family peptidase [Gemmatimonadales bacterium]|nr:M15 family peptidase [Gemmatimonadales bacterium]
MGYAYSKTSEVKLQQCHPDLQRVFRHVIQFIDHTVLTGHRGQLDQEEMYRTGRSQRNWPNSKHNGLPAKAIDVAPYPIDWYDRERFYYFAGFVMGIAAEMRIPLRYGGDWDGDWETRDNGFDDLCHFELV